MWCSDELQYIINPLYFIVPIYKSYENEWIYSLPNLMVVHVNSWYLYQIRSWSDVIFWLSCSKKAKWCTWLNNKFWAIYLEEHGSILRFLAVHPCYRNPESTFVYSSFHTGNYSKRSSNLFCSEEMMEELACIWWTMLEEKNF